MHAKLLCAWHFSPIFAPTKTRITETMKKQLHAIILLWLCMLVQAVSVFPHHHHAEALCLGHDMETARPAKGTHACGSECITHFHLTMPSSGSHVSYKKNVSRPSCLLRTSYDFPVIHGPQTSKGTYQTDRTDLYLSLPVGGKGLRAPPLA
ncbi:conserved domain protein [Paraprevotella xylaniphila YIT 11841]|uniref:Conserved domain protein n=2 Tax=Paraprevotella xylaniphila TaxID=454155 RepID=F3QVB4_9BACT|nr:conserved domain protein [Paraprevotella xylaniphila YIT 11841]